jgi:hypothetical protein
MGDAEQSPQNLSENMKGREQLGELSADGRVKLKWILKK